MSSNDDEKDGAEAVQELRRLALWGDMDAQFNLGLCYHEGIGAAKSHVDAAWWFRRAAKQGHPVATNMIDGGNADSGTDHSEVHDEDSDGWEFIEDDPGGAELCAMRRRSSDQQGLAWHLLECSAGAADEWDERTIDAPHGQLNVLFVSSVAGPRVAKVCGAASPLASELMVGDVVTRLNGADVSSLSGNQFARKLRAEARSRRQLTIRTSTPMRAWQERSALAHDSFPRVVSIRPDV